MSSIQELNCWVLGEETSRVFTVEIQGTKNVSTLKKAIKEEKKPGLDHLPVSVMWKLAKHSTCASITLL
jgi:Crinkler effector protein N-terminal domain